MQVSSILYLATHACIEDTYIPDFLFKSHYSRSLPLKSGIYVSSIDLYSYGDISNVRMLLYTCPHTATYAPAGVVSRGLHRCKRGAGWVAACARWEAVGWDMLTYADVCWRMRRMIGWVAATLRWEDVGWEMLTYADVCWCMLTYAEYIFICTSKSRWVRDVMSKAWPITPPHSTLNL
jgi:hypothetical protein